jgi:Holliday junction resolvase
MKSKKEFGNELEQRIANKFIELGYKYARPSKASGAKGERGDISGVDGIATVEAKNRNTSNVTIKEAVWKKLCSEIPLHIDSIPMYAVQNKEKTCLICLDIDDFFKIFKVYVENKKENHE